MKYFTVITTGLLMAGCMSVDAQYNPKTGQIGYKASRFLNDAQFAGIDAQGRNGEKLKVEGYKSETSQVVESAFEMAQSLSQALMANNAELQDRIAADPQQPAKPEEENGDLFENEPEGE